MGENFRHARVSNHSLELALRLDHLHPALLHASAVSVPDSYEFPKDVPLVCAKATLGVVYRVDLSL
jgi:hypothetical protein